jgi:hypothetical protein
VRLETIVKQTFYLFIATFLCEQCLGPLAFWENISKKVIESSLVELLLFNLFNGVKLVVTVMLSISWGVYCGIKDKEGSLNNLSVFWLFIISIFTILSNIWIVGRHVGCILYLSRHKDIFGNLISCILAIQLVLIQLGLSFPQWIVTLRTYQAIKNKFGPQNRLERNKVSS